MSLFRKKNTKKPRMLIPSNELEEQGDTPTTSSLKETEELIKGILGHNDDLSIKHFKIFGQYQAAIFYFSNLINQDI